MSPSPPLRKSGKDALFEAGLLTNGLNTDLLSAPSHPVGQWLFVADFVAVHSCEGSGGFAPLFPITSNASWLSKTGMQERFSPLAIFPVKQSEFQQVELIYEAGIDRMGRGGELNSKKYKRPRSPVQKIEGVLNSLFA